MNRLRPSRLIVVAVAAMAASADASSAVGQAVPGVHYRYPSQTPPGQVGFERLQQGGPVEGYFQPVSLSAPKDVMIEMAREGGWSDATDGVLITGMQLGQPYRVRLTHLPLHPDEACYPTIEVVDRTYPPPGLELKFPVPIIFNEDDIRLAMEGLFVTRVVYVEDPAQAIPGAQQPGEQLWHDAGTNANALEVADRLGRPVAIVRMGGRTPDESRGPDRQFLYGSPTWQYFATVSRPQIGVKQNVPAPLPMSVKSARRPMPTELR